LEGSELNIFVGMP